MTRKETVVVLDDLDGTAGAKPEEFGYHGVTYEIDLSDDNAGKLRDFLADYIAVARKAASTPATRTAARKADAAEVAAQRDQNRKIKEWARENGFSVADRGRLPVEVLGAYNKAHSIGEASTNGDTDDGSGNQPPEQPAPHVEAAQHHEHEHHQPEHVPAFSAV